MALSRDRARIALATIRLVNGALALLAPGVMLRRLEAGQQTDPATGADPDRVAVYPLRMFGIRTVVLGLQRGPRSSGAAARNGQQRLAGQARPKGRSPCSSIFIGPDWATQGGGQ